MRLDRKKLMLFIGIIILILILLSYFDTNNKFTGNAVAEENLVAYYNFDTDANDVSGNGNNGDINGATLVSGKFGQGYEFGGDGDQILVPDDSSINPSSWTIGAWVKYNGEATGFFANTTFLAKSDATNRDYLLSVGNENLEGVCQYRIGSNSVIARGSANSISKGVWTHIMCSYDSLNNELTIFIDGTPRGSSIGDFSPPDNGFSLSIGSRTEDGGKIGFKGLIDEVRIYNKKLSYAEVEEIYQENPIAPVCTPACLGKSCGSDGCGGSCGGCSGTEICNNNVCIVNTTITNPSIVTCIPNCLGKSCGSDGCGGSCGNCGTGESCVSGHCFINQLANLSGGNLVCIDDDINVNYLQGINYYQKGKIEISRGIFSYDYCFDANILYEWYCDFLNISKMTIYNCPNGCKDGACNKGSYSRCERTDNGDIYIKGQLCLYDKNNVNICSFEDFCGTGLGSLSQMECISDEDYQPKWRGCLLGCVDGACVCEQGDCPAGYNCEGGKCVSIPGSIISTNSSGQKGLLQRLFGY